MPMLGVIAWKRATTRGVVIQMIATMVIIPFWAIMGPKIYPALPALMLGLIVAPIVFIVASLLTKPDNQEVVGGLWESYRGL